MLLKTPDTERIEVPPDVPKDNLCKLCGAVIPPYMTICEDCEDEANNG